MVADFSLSGTNLFQHAATTAPAQSACPSGTSGLAKPQDDFETFGPAQPGHSAATCAPCAGGFSHAQQQFADPSQNLEPGALPSRLGSPFLAGMSSEPRRSSTEGYSPFIAVPTNPVQMMQSPSSETDIFRFAPSDSSASTQQVTAPGPIFRDESNCNHTGSNHCDT